MGYMDKESTKCFEFTSNTMGLPDHVYKDPSTDKPHAGTLRNNIHMTGGRTQGITVLSYFKKKASSAIKAQLRSSKPSLIDIYQIPDFRRNTYSVFFGMHLDYVNSKGIGAQKFINSFEFFTFYSYAPELFESIGEDLSDAEEGVGSAYGKAIVETERPVEWHRAIKIANRAGQKLINELQDCEDIEPEREQLLADVALAAGTADSPEVFNLALSIRPSLLKYFSDMVSRYKPITAITVEGEPEVCDMDEYANGVDFLDALETLLASCKENPRNEALSRSLSILAYKYADWVKENQSVDVSEHFDLWLRQMYSVGNFLKLELYPHIDAQPGLFGVFSTAWGGFFQSEAAKSLQANFICEIHSKALGELPSWKLKLAKLESVLSEKRLFLSEAQNEVAKGPVAERKLKAKTSELNIEVSSSELDLSRARDEISLELLPPDADFDIYEHADVDITVDTGLFAEEIKADLAAFVKAMEEDCGRPEEPDAGEEVAATNNIEAEIDGQSSVDVVESVVTSEDEDEGDSITDEIENPEETVESVENVEETQIERVSPSAVSPEELDGEDTDADVIEDIAVASKNLLEETLIEKNLRELDEGALLSSGDVNQHLSALTLSKGVNFAAQLAYQVTNNGLAEECIPYHLFKSVHYGVFTFNDRACFNKVRRELHKLNLNDHESWSSQKNADIVPYLLFAATFQPALFGGNCSSATTWLRELLATEFLDKNSKALVEDTLELANRGEQVTLEYLRSGDSQGDASNFDVAKLDHWAQKINQNRRGYAPILKALKHSLEHGVMGEISAVLRENRREAQALVEDFVERYESMDGSMDLLNMTLGEISAYSIDGINRIGRIRFFHRVVELIEIAQDWLVSEHSAHGDFSEKYAKKFKTRVENSITYFDEICNSSEKGKAHRAGACITSQALKNLLATVENPTTMWVYDRVKGWYYLPELLMEIDGTQDAPKNQCEWLLNEVSVERDYREILDAALEGGHTQLAELIRLELLDAGIDEDFSDVAKHFQEVKANLSKRCFLLDGKLENALLAGLLDSMKAEVFSAELNETREVIELIRPLERIRDIREFIEDMESTLRELTANTKQNLVDRYNRAISEIRSRVSEDSVPPAWVQSMNMALKSDNLSVVDEMLEELELAVKNKEPIHLVDADEVKKIPVFKEFVPLESTIFEEVKSCDNRKKLWNKVGDGSLGLEFAEPLPKTLHQAIIALDEWKNARPQNKMNKDFYEKVVAILSLVGIKPEDTQYKGTLDRKVEYRKGHGFSTMTITIMPSPSTRPFTLFGEGISVLNLPVIIAHQAWSTQQLKEIMSAHNIHSECLLISAMPMSPDLRKEFSIFTKRENKTVLHLDVVNLLFLTSRQENGAENIAVRNFLWLTAPYTYFNPYSDALLPPIREMRYGREKQIESLLKMVNGSAIVFGGRQLGKSTILKEVEARFHRPEQKQYALSVMVDKNYSHKLSSGEGNLKWGKQIIWNEIYGAMIKYKLCKDVVVDRSVDNVDRIIEVVKKAMVNNKDIKFMAIFDEIDPILDLDSGFKFQIFRELRDFVAQQEVHGRFKVIIGGLQNVKRFENSPNYPLNQLGASVQISIMPSQEALHLVIEPLLAAGYEFESPQVANRIMAITNRHPGLLQLFCFELIKYLSKLSDRSDGIRLIREEDVINVGAMKHVEESIHNRFDLTLNLDQRYQVIVYSLIADDYGAQPFTPMESKSLAESWLPDPFSNYSTKQYEAYLIELVGLGVLKQVSDGRYSLRNTNVLKLLSRGDDDAVADELERAIEQQLTLDPLERHSYNPDVHTAPLPITSRDEKAILGVVDVCDEKAIIRRAQENKEGYTVSVIVGSEALGMGNVESTLPALHADDFSIGHSSNPLSRYKSHSVETGQYKSLADFEQRLLNSVFKQAKKDPQMVFIKISEDTALATLLGMLNSAHRMTEDAKSLMHPARLVFLMDPKAYWLWLSNADKTHGREQTQPFIRLYPWKIDAIRLFIELLGMHDSSDEVDRIYEITEGWYFALENLRKISRSHPTWKRLNEFKVPFEAIKSVGSKKAASTFLKKTGLMENQLALDVMIGILAEGSVSGVDSEDIQIILGENGHEESAEVLSQVLINWLVGINLLVPERKTTNQGGDKGDAGKILYTMPPSVNHTLALWGQND